MHGRGERTWPDGRAYVGQWKQDMMWGRGQLVCPSGEVFKGTFKANALHGEGERCWANGDRYVGQFAEGEMEGIGRFHEQASRETFEGQWLHGRLYGEGRVQRADGSTYLGEWVDGIPEGTGRETWPDGSFYEGPFKRHCAQGRGLKVFADGSWFEGMFCDGEFDGHGIFHWCDSTEFEGLWHRNKIAGPGCHRFPTGTTIVGTFQNHGASGEGTKSWACGCVYTGSLLRNRIDKLGTLKWPDGRCYIGAFEDDAMHGEGTLVWADEEGICTYRGGFVRNAFEGFGSLEWSSGAKYEGEFSAGLYHGQGTFSWPNQRGVYLGSWVRGEMCGEGSMGVGESQEEAGVLAYEYVGDFSGGHMEGKGFVTFHTRDDADDVDLYEGDFKASRFSGQGTFTWGTCHQLEGLFEDSYCNRVGRKVYPDQRIYTGELRYDLEHGKGVMREPGGREFVALWRDGEVLKELVMTVAPEFDLVGNDLPPDLEALVPSETLCASVVPNIAEHFSRISFIQDHHRENQATVPLELLAEVDEERSEGEGASQAQMTALEAGAPAKGDAAPAAPAADGEVAGAEGPDAAAAEAEAEAAAAGAGRDARKVETTPMAWHISEVSHGSRVESHVERQLGAKRKPLLPIIDESGALAEGKTMVVFLNGDRYIGNLKDGRKHGRGMYVYADLETYRGIWAKDMLEGVRHPVTEDVLPIEVRRLGPPQEEVPPYPDSSPGSPSGNPVAEGEPTPKLALPKLNSQEIYSPVTFSSMRKATSQKWAIEEEKDDVGGGASSTQVSSAAGQ